MSKSPQTSTAVSDRKTGPRSRRRPLSATQHHPTTSLVGISWHCNELWRSVSSILTVFRHHNPLYFNHLQMHFYFNGLQEKQENQIVINMRYFIMIQNKLIEGLE